ncbi:MAG: Tim44/TimA family putative adaptor protein [Rickettsiales bacterium]|nr:Tim44/TimA family putative adaptor protein [Rickettsiales bacterium]
MYALDIIIFAIIAIFLLIKLFSVLGRRNDESFTTQKSSCSNLRTKTIKEVEVLEKQNITPEEKIKVLDPSFSTNNFIRKARTAHEIVLHAYADGNTQTLSELVSIDIMRDLAYKITQREEVLCVAKIISFKNISESVTSTTLQNYTAKIYISIKYEIVFYIEDKEQKLINGHKTKSETHSQEICFVRNLQSEDPTWKIEKLSNIPF